MKSSRTARTPLRLCALVLLSVGLLFAVGAAQATSTSTGTVVAWGCRGDFIDDGKCNVPSGLSGVTEIAAGDHHGLALKGDGTVVAWGCGASSDYGQCSVPNGLSGVTAIAAGSIHSLALRSDGTVVAWGCGRGLDFGECSVPSGLSGVTAIAAGFVHSLAVRGDGTVAAWGCGIDDFGQCNVPSGLSGVTAVAAGAYHSLALKHDGTVVAWGGCIFYAQCNVPPGLSGATAIAAGYAHSLAVRADGVVVAWGCSAFDHGQCSMPPGLSGVTAVAAGVHHSLALNGDGTVVAWGCLVLNGFGDFGQCSVPSGLAGVSAIAAGISYSLALIGPRKQTITFEELANKTYGDPDFTVSATASSGLPVSFTVNGNCSIRGSTVHLTGAGSCTLTASQPGDSNVAAAPDVLRTFSIGAAPCTVPKVVGTQVASARLTIAKSHCRTGKVGFADSRIYKKGIVISQNRRPGGVLPARSKIDLIVSRGPRR